LTQVDQLSKNRDTKIYSTGETVKKNVKSKTVLIDFAKEKSPSIEKGKQIIEELDTDQPTPQIYSGMNSNRKN
jgi:hypothetical protein